MLHLRCGCEIVAGSCEEIAGSVDRESGSGWGGCGQSGKKSKTADDDQDIIVDADGCCGEVASDIGIRAHHDELYMSFTEKTL